MFLTFSFSLKKKNPKIIRKKIKGKHPYYRKDFDFYFHIVDRKNKHNIWS